MKPAQSGTASSPITFTSYPGEKATVSGADVVSGRAKSSGSIYKASLDAKLVEAGSGSVSRTQLGRRPLFDNGSGHALVHHSVTWHTFDGIQVNGYSSGPGPSEGDFQTGRSMSGCKP